MNSKLNKFFLWSIFILLDCVIASGIAEIWARRFIPTTNICYDIDKTLGVRFCPNQETYGYVEKGYANIFTTNSQGFHDIERPLQKMQNTFRIHMYGDSFLQGKALPLNETIPLRVDNFLNAQDFRVKFESANMATGDDSTSCQILAYEEIGRKYKPDLVICLFSEDFGDNIYKVNGVSYSPYHAISDDGNLVYVPPIYKDTNTLWEKFKKNSRLYRVLANKLFESKSYNDFSILVSDINTIIKTYVFQKTSKDSQKNYREWQREVCTKESWPLTLKLIKHFNDTVKKDGANFVLVDVLPFSDSFVGPTYSNKDLEKFCIDNGITYIQIYDKYTELNSYKDRKRFWFRDNHPTVEGNREFSLYLSLKLEKFLKQNHLDESMTQIRQWN